MTGIFDGVFAGAEADVAFRRTVHSGSTTVRLIVNWNAVAPRVRPPGFRPADPGDPAYRWETIDRQITLALAHRLSPIVSIMLAPDWAEGGSQTRYPGTVRPDPAQLGLFATAAARRYNGSFAGLPRVRYWQVWNEPNWFAYLWPQRSSKGEPLSPALYRAMVNRFADAVHGVRNDNLVVAGGLSPFGADSSYAVPPLEFMREMLCMKGRAKPRPTCRTRSHFDVWSLHPYTLGRPTTHAQHPDHVSLGDIPEMRKLLVAAARARHVVARNGLRLWVTEFSWDTSPPDPMGVPERLQARWIPEALFRMHQMGVSLVTWFQLRDEPFPSGSYQSGLYFHGRTSLEDARPKLALTGFRFPFVALPERNHVRIWGRTPAGRAGWVTVERKVETAWRAVARLRTNRYGIFTMRVRKDGKRPYRARFGAETSLSFAPTPTPNMKLTSPFGTPP